MSFRRPGIGGSAGSTRSILNEGSNISGSSRSVYSGGGTKAFEKDQLDEIFDEDLADASEDISLSSKAGENSFTGSVEFKEHVDFQPDIPKGYIDDVIVQDVLRSTDDRLKRKNSFSTKKKMALGIIGAFAFFTFLMCLQDSSETKRIEKTIEDRSTAFEFNDHDDYIKPVTEPIETVTVMTTKTETSVGSNILEDEIPLEDTTVFPLAMEQFFVDPRLSTIDTSHETPVFWQVPFVGGVFQNFMTGCSKKVLASNFKLTDDDSMRVHMVRESLYVNADLSTIEGIGKAGVEGLAKSRLADVIVSNHVHLIASTLFDASHKGRLFTALKHPVDRCISEYYHILPTFDGIHTKEMNLEEFVSSKFSDKDWMTRFLIGKRNGELVPEDLQLAKEILRRRCLIGLHDRIEQSIHLFENYFGWTAEGKNAGNYHRCKQEVISNEKAHAREIFGRIGKVEKGDVVYEKIVNLNKYDMELYWYAHDLFEKQQSWAKYGP